MATKNNPSEYDCYANAEPDEPMFVLLGRDKHAPTLVWLWSTLRELGYCLSLKLTNLPERASNVPSGHDRSRFFARMPQFAA